LRFFSRFAAEKRESGTTTDSTRSKQPALRVPRCDACGELIFDNDAADRIQQALRERLGLPSPDQIRNAS
jgi:hypothetical protein